MRFDRFKKFFAERWSGEDYPGAEPRFFWQKLARDVATFILFPAVSILIYRFASGPSVSTPKPRIQNQRTQVMGDSKSQIIEFSSGGRGGGTGLGGFPKRSPGTLVKLKLLNVVETYSTAPVHAQIVDTGLGKEWLGGVLIGDATPDPTYERISIDFRYARDPRRDGTAFTISARALSLDGTYGLVASKKEGFVARSVLSSATSVPQELQSRSNSPDLRDILIRALTNGLFQELGTSSRVEQNRSQVLTLQPGVEFFAELTNSFPGASK